MDSEFLHDSRRRFGAHLLGGGLLLLGAGCATAPPARRTLDFTGSAKDNLYAYAKMAGDLSGKPVYSTLKGHLFGVQAGEVLRPLCGIWGWGTGRYEMRPDGKVAVTWREVAAYTDIDTGAFLEKWRNPYSGEMVDVMPVQNDPVNFLLSEDLPPSSVGRGGPREFLPGNYGQPGKFIFPWEIDRHHDTATIQYDVHGRRDSPLDPKVWPRESPGPKLRVTEAFQYQARLSHLEDPSRTGVHCTGGWQRIASWLPWMVMDQRPGDLFYRTVFRKLDSFDQLDPALMAYAKANFAAFLTPPEKWTPENVSSFDVYKSKRKPLPPLAQASAPK